MEKIEMKISESLLRKYVRRLILESNEVRISDMLNKLLREIMLGDEAPIVKGEESQRIAEIQQLLVDLGFSVAEQKQELRTFNRMRKSPLQVRLMLRLQRA